MNTERTAHQPARPGQQYLRYAVAVPALALLAALATPRVASAQQDWTDETFDQVVFRGYGTAAAVRTRLDSELSLT